MMHRAADILGLALLAFGALGWVLGRLPPLRHGRDVDWADAVAGLGGAVVGGWAAVTWGGLGALPWMWLGLFLWWGLRNLARPDEAPRTVTPPPAMHAIASVLALGAAASLLAGSFEALSGAAIIGQGLLMLALLLAGVTRGSWIVSPVAVLPGLALMGGALLVATQHEGGLVGALTTSSSAATDWQAGALGAMGALTAVVVHVGLAAAAAPGAIASPSGAGGGLRRLLLAGLASTSVGLGVSGGSPGGDRLDAPELRAADGRPHMRPLERPHVRAFLPSPRGQSIVLPSDTPLKADHQYTVHFRANPRGYEVGMLSETRNVVAVPAFESTRDIEAVYFREKSGPKSLSAIWDRRIEVQTKTVTLPSGAQLRELTPKDPEVELRNLAKELQGPFIPLGDISVEVAVFEASAPASSIGDHLAMVELVPEGPRADFDLQTVVRLGFRGPLLEARPAAPLAFAGDERADALPLGSRRRAELRAPERGLRLGEVRPNGELAVPAWGPLTELRYVAFHPRMRPIPAERDPSVGTEAEGAEATDTTDTTALEPVDPDARSFYIPVRVVQGDGGPKIVRGRLRLEATEAAQIDLRSAAKLAAYEGPYLMVPPQPLWLELHSGLNMADPPNTALAERGRADHPYADARVWVPLGAGTEPVALAELGTPHAGAWIEAGMLGPFAAEADATSAGARLGWFGLLAALVAWAWGLAALWPAQSTLRLSAGAAAIIAGISLPPMPLLIAAAAFGLLATFTGTLTRSRA